ncbi:MAG TPA: SDR family oxidoreductase [Flavilitoribacter sp.]|nr:SDR family oxidoreductase [Flavilitoribacter sp.]HMQ89836.1 SDR family oxidoreductase [Flavilitoribacter sp.]
MKNKQFLVIGGSSGIGLALTKMLAESGAGVRVVSRKSDGLPGLAGVEHYPFDVLQEEVPADLFPEQLDGLAYCPGSITLKPFKSLKPAQFQADFELNVLGAVRVIQGALGSLKRVERSGIVLFSTVAVGQGMNFHTAVATAKGAVEGLTRSLAAELAPNIRVNCIAPSLTDTPMAERLLNTPEKKEASAQRHPLKRVGSPEDIAAMAHFLLDDQSSWISGQVIGVDGGMSAIRL